jgi:hypothetical protein
MTGLHSTATTTPDALVLGLIVGGAVLAVLLVSVVVFCIVKHFRARPVDPAVELRPPPSSHYAAVTALQRDGEYDQGNLSRQGQGATH